MAQHTQLQRQVRPLPLPSSTRRSEPSGSAPIAVLVVAVVAVIGLWDAVRRGDGVASYDLEVSRWVIGERRAPPTSLAWSVTSMGDLPVLEPLTVLVVAWALWRRHWRTAVEVSGGMLLAYVTTAGVKDLVARPRPGASMVAGAVDAGYAFPSGHTLLTTVFVGLVAGIVVPRVRRGWRPWVIVVATLMSVAVGLSRIYLGYHWLTDVLAGWLFGAAVLALVKAADRRTGHSR